MNPKRTISLVLTTFNRFDMVLEAISKVINDPRVGEIVICDDRSTDDSYDRLVNHFDQNLKVHVFDNLRNLDCYRNKHKAMEWASSEWCILFDSDNILPVKYLDTLFALPQWDPDIVYCPEFAEPNFDYTAFSGHLVDRGTVAAFMKQKHFATCLNTCNYFVHRDNYLNVWDRSVDPHTSDSIYQMLNWFRAGKKAMIVPGLRYFHRVHDGSHYIKNHHKTGNFAKMVENELSALK